MPPPSAPNAYTAVFDAGDERRRSLGLPVQSGTPQDPNAPAPVEVDPAAVVVPPPSSAAAPVSAPSNAGRDVFREMGIPAPERQRFVDAGARAAETGAAAQEAVAGLGAEREALGEHIANIQRPEAPDLQDVPEAPRPEPRDVLRVFGQMLPVLAMLGGMASRTSATAALRAGASAVAAARARDTEALHAAQQEWENNVQQVLAQNQVSLQEYQVASDLMKTDMDSALAQLNVIAGREGNAVMQSQLAQGDLAAVSQGMALRMNAYAALAQAHAQQTQANAALTTARGASALRSTNDERQLRGQYQTVTGDINTIRSSYRQIQDLARMGTGQGDVGLIYSYMKMLDPGSTVREGEYATAQQTGSLPQSLVARYNQLIRGDRLAPEQRAGIVDAAGVLNTQAEQRMHSLNQQYTQIAQSNGFDPQNILVDPFASEAPPQSSPTTPSPFVPPPEAIAILRQRPQTAAQFEQTFNLPPGGARQYLRPGPDQ